MQPGSVLFTDFSIFLPQYKADQVEHGLEWLAEAHTFAHELTTTGVTSNSSIYKDKMKKLLSRVGSSKNVIEHRYTEIEDFFHFDWNAMQIYRLHDDPAGAPIDVRMEFYRSKVKQAYEHMYESASQAPSHLFDVTCTGFTSPSAAQEFICQKGWTDRTQITNVYNMGCFAAVPAVQLAAHAAGCSQDSRPVHVVHSELCTLHLNPTLHQIEQLVVQSLFADGYIKYSCYKTEDLLKKSNPLYPSKIAKNGLIFLATLTQIVPHTAELMKWNLGKNAFLMGLSKDIPEKIRYAICEFNEKLLQKARVAPGKPLCYAIHPGGPRIIESVAQELELTDEQIRHSLHILKTRGNMSSATLPHIWQAMLSDPSVPPGTLIVSLAFGPGLTLAGAVFQKV